GGRAWASLATLVSSVASWTSKSSGSGSGSGLLVATGLLVAAGFTSGRACGLGVARRAGLLAEVELWLPIVTPSSAAAAAAVAPLAIAWVASSPARSIC